MCRPTDFLGKNTLQMALCFEYIAVGMRKPCVHVEACAWDQPDNMARVTDHSPLLKSPKFK